MKEEVRSLSRSEGVLVARLYRTYRYK